MAVGTWVDGNNSCRSDEVASTPKTTMAKVTSPTIRRLAKLSLVSDVMSVKSPSPSADVASTGHVASTLMGVG